MGLALRIFPNVGTALMEVMKVCHQAVVDLRSPGEKKKLFSGSVQRRQTLFTWESCKLIVAVCGCVCV